MPACVNLKSSPIVLPAPRNGRCATIQILSARATRCYNAEPWPIGDRSKRVSAKLKRAPTQRQNSQNSTNARAMPWWHLNWRSGTRRPESMPKPRAGTRLRRNDSAGRNGRPRPRRRWRACARARRLWESAEGTKVEDVPEAEVAESGEEPAPEPSGPTLQARPALQARPTSQARPAFQARAARASDPQEQERVSEAEVAGDVTEGEPGQSEEMKDQAEEMEGSEAVPAAAGTPGSARPKPRRRGRRGGRNRRRGPATASGAAPAPARVPTARPAPRQDEVAPAQPVTVAATPPEEAIAPSSFAPAVAWHERSRAGEPALASRMAQLESQVRRLLACPPVQLDLAETAPAGPGVLLLSDSDQVTHYYIESCQTLRIAIANLTRGGRGAKDNPKLCKRPGREPGHSRISRGELP